ncbi:hypothetical protein DXT76_13115 [Halobacillus trueperi]|uniref:YopA central domain-containing protein n=1 Tax=Halobacillus trueperi TaxID=156205 RepID=A0A3D8VLV1_9BACI|nr:hypothetical protein [Halobacillus trueperi]RDY70386.1 hypothetical protein DXT76_13115 [Halobacillus trueperi]
MVVIYAIDSKFLLIGEKHTVYKGVFKLQIDGQFIEVDGKIEYTFKPFPKITYEGAAAEVVSYMGNNNTISLIVPEMNTHLVTLDEIKNHKYVKGVIAGYIEDENNEKFDSYVLHVVNFDKFIGELIEKNNFSYSGGVKLQESGWNIDIQMRHDYKSNETFKALKETNGYDITHLIEIKKTDGSLFGKNEIIELEEILVWILCMCSGRHVGFPVRMGIRNKEIIYEIFSTPLITRYKSRSNWFPRQKGDIAIKELFYAFYHLFQDEFVKENLREIIHWYVEALNSNFIDNSTIISQIGLEKLAYILLTQQHPQIISNNKYKKNGLKTNLRFILDKVGVDTTLGESHNPLDENFGNGPEALVDFRNHIAHPKRDEVINSYEIYDRYQIRNLGVYYLEILLLYFVNYQRVYSNRLKFPSPGGEYERVPWMEGS